jgi:hypothetical protein
MPINLTGPIGAGNTALTDMDGSLGVALDNPNDPAAAFDLQLKTHIMQQRWTAISKVEAKLNETCMTCLNNI